jgi:hypothetical protein
VPDRATNTSILPLLSILATAMTQPAAVYRVDQKKKGGSEKPSLTSRPVSRADFCRTNFGKAEIRKYHPQRPALFDGSLPQPGEKTAGDPVIGSYPISKSPHADS